MPHVVPPRPRRNVTAAMQWDWRGCYRAEATRHGERRMRTGALIVTLIAGLVAGVVVQAAVPADFLFRNTETDGSGMPYRLFVPPGTVATQQYPLIVFLHGAGEYGTNNTSQLNNNANGAMALVSDANLAVQKTFMAAPQCPTNSSCWAGSTQLARLNTMLDRIATEFRIDPERIHVTGLSMGGNGTWSLVLNRPDRFASAVPMSGYGGTGSAASVSAIPFWYFHAIDDGTVNVSGSRDQVNALRAANARVVYTEYATGGHGIWPNAYRTPLLFAWMMAQRRGQAVTTAAPVVRIEQPSTAATWTTDLAAVALSGSADNAADAITGVTWALRNGASGTTTGTSAWSTPPIALSSGINDVAITARGPSYHAPYGGATTFNANLRIHRVGSIPQPGELVLAANSGGAAYAALDGTAFSADTAFEGGDVQVSNHTIANTPDPTLYNSWRWGNFAYRVAVPAGPYEVTLHFAETYNSGIGQRRFNVSVQGQRVLEEFDIAAEAGLDTALVRRFGANAANGEVLVQVANGSVGNARLDAIQVRRSADVVFASGFDPL